MRSDEGTEERAVLRSITINGTGDIGFLRICKNGVIYMNPKYDAKPSKKVIGLRRKRTLDNLLSN